MLFLQNFVERSKICCKTERTIHKNKVLTFNDFLDNVIIYEKKISNIF